MPVLHPLTFAQTFSGRLKGLQDRLDRLEDLLPHPAMSEEAQVELSAIQKRLLGMILDARHMSAPLLQAVERQYPDCMGRTPALSELGHQADRQERETEGWSH